MENKNQNKENKNKEAELKAKLEKEEEARIEAEIQKEEAEKKAEEEKNKAPNDQSKEIEELKAKLKEAEEAKIKAENKLSNAKATGEVSAKPEKSKAELEKDEFRNAYIKYMDLKFIYFKVGNNKMKKWAKDKLEELEIIVKKAKGKKSQITQTFAIGSDKVRVVEGVPVIKEDEKIIEEAGGLVYSKVFGDK